MITEFSKKMPSFIPLNQKKKVPVNGKPLNNKLCNKKSGKGSAIPSNSASRHEKCFQNAGANKLSPAENSIVRIRKRNQHEQILRPKSTNIVVSPKSPRNSYSNPTKPQQALQIIKAAKNQPRIFGSRQINRSPVAFGRSISKERTFAEEKKRLENILPSLRRGTFEASTNILRDPSLKSPQDVKKAFQSLAESVMQRRSHSVPRSCIRCRYQPINQFPNMTYFPEYEHTVIIKDYRSNAGKSCKKTSLSYPLKHSSSASLAKSNSTFSLESPYYSATQLNERTHKSQAKLKAQNQSEMNRNMIESKSEFPLALPLPEKSPASAKLAYDEYKNITTIPALQGVPSFWDESSARLAKSLPQPLSEMSSFNVYNKTCPPSFASSDRDNAETTNCSIGIRLDDNSRKFSPTREIRISQSRNMRSPSRRKIESCRSNLREESTKIVRASSLSSADDRSNRGIHLCRELAHSATTLDSDQHSPTCSYLSTSKRFTELSKFYSILERIGQLEKTTSTTEFRPLRKSSELLDYDEWRKVRSHEKAEKELNHLVAKLKEEQEKKDFLFRSKDINEIKWNKDFDLGLISKKRSVEDLREDFEKILIFQNYDRRLETCRTYNRRNTISNLPHNFGLPIKKGEVKRVTNQQLNYENIESSDPGFHNQVSEEYIVTVQPANNIKLSSPLRVRCHSTLTKQQLLENATKKQEALKIKPNINGNLANETSHPSQIPLAVPPQVPPRPPIEFTKASQNDLRQVKTASDNISQKIKYFEERKYDEPTKTIYRACEDSSADEGEALCSVEEKDHHTEKPAYVYRMRKELCSSLTNLNDLFGEKRSQKVNFRTPSLPPRPPEIYNFQIAKVNSYFDEPSFINYADQDIRYEERDFSPSQSQSPQSQSSSYLQRVNTGEVQKIRRKFENLHQYHSDNGPFFGIDMLRKVRSDPELLITVSESKDILSNEGDVSWLTHKFESQNKWLKSKPKAERSFRLRPKLRELMSKRLSPTIINCNNINKRKEHLTSKTSLDKRNNSKAKISSSVPDMRSNAQQVLHVSRQSLDKCHQNKLSLNIKNILSKHKRQPAGSVRGEKTAIATRDDCFANQKFDPIKHQPKARYVPDNAEAGRCKPRQTKRETNVKFKVSPNLYHESDVSIYFKTPVCQEPRSPITDEELAARQAEYMQKLYQEERRRKYLQELQDMNARRHTDNFTPSQKSPIALNRYDDFPADLAPKSPLKQDLQTKAVARALYNFQGQNPRELCFKKGDIIYIRRTIDKNWYEGERNAMVGLFPANYVEIISRGEMQYLKQQTRQKPSEGQARAKYNFQAQSGIELSLNKGELVSLTRRVDENWFEGRIANRKGIFPVAYVEVLIDIGAEDVVTRTDRTTHRHMDTLRSNINQEFNTLIRHGYHTQTGSNTLYKYQPQNSDELELFEGDLVHVLEKCDDGWYVGTSQRTGCFGTFPGNYVERI
uniref:SH3 domain-containing protein n=1 Tax=Glossina austeni TaxID=7395 RepID=A0A1A9US85_GLOAU